jgi:hypothetical protein
MQEETAALTAGLVFAARCETADASTDGFVRETALVPSGAVQLPP